MKIQTQLLQEVNISRFLRMQNVIDMNPPYQREGNIWKSEAQSLLIDSIINGLDVPKLYFEEQTIRRFTKDGFTYLYAVIDGKQRLSAISAFLRDEITLPDNFIYFEDENIRASQMTLSQLRKAYPLLAQRFYDFQLPIVRVLSDSGDLIEEMFQRLNASSSLNAAERRNALNVPTRDAANALAEHDLLVRCSPIRSARYKYRELGAKFLAIEDQLATKQRIQDTKSVTLYDLFIATRDRPGKPARIDASTMDEYKDSAKETLDQMSKIFHTDDRLLASIGTVVVYYICFRDAKFRSLVSRELLSDFENLRRQAARMDEEDPSYGELSNIRLREYNGLVQSSNDGSALTRRAEILQSYIVGYRPDNPMHGIENAAEGDLPDIDESEE